MPSPPSLFKQLPSSPELLVRLSGLPIPGTDSGHCYQEEELRIFLSNLGNNFGVGVVSHHSDPPNLASAGSKSSRDLDQVVLHGVATHRHEVNALGYFDRVHRRQPRMEQCWKEGKEGKRTWLWDLGQTSQGQDRLDRPVVCQQRVCVAASSSRVLPRRP